MRHPRISGIVATAFLAATFAASAAGSGDDVHAALEEAHAALSAGLERGDATAIAKLYTADAMVLPPNDALASGAAQVHALWKSYVGSMKGLRLKPTTIETQGDFTVETGTYAALGEGGAVIDRGKYVNVWKREDGGWKLHRDIWNSDAPAAPQAPAAAQ